MFNGVIEGMEGSDELGNREGMEVDTTDSISTGRVIEVGVWETEIGGDVKGDAEAKRICFH